MTYLSKFCLGAGEEVMTKEVSITIEEDAGRDVVKEKVGNIHVSLMSIKKHFESNR